MLALGRPLLLTLLIVTLGGFIFLATWNDPPAPQRIEVVIPDERLPR